MKSGLIWLSGAVILFIALPACASDKSFLADLRSARSLIGEMSEVHDLQSKGQVSGTYARTSQQQAKDEIGQFAKKYHGRAKKLEQLLDAAMRAIEDHDQGALRLVADQLAALARDAAAH